MDPSVTGLIERAQAAFAQLQASLTAEERDWLAKVPVRAAIDALDTQPPGLDFGAVTAELEAVDSAAVLLGDPGWVGKYWNLVLLELVARTLQVPAPYRLPAEVQQLQLVELERIVETCAAGTAPADPLGDGEFRIDIGLSRGALVPFGYTMGELESRLPDWLPDRPGGYPDAGDAPWLTTHIIGERAHDMKDERAWNEALRNVALFFIANPDYAGYYGLGWLADEALCEISPHLAFVREQMLASGAIIVTLGEAPEEIVELAISTSKTRRRMYEEGRWTPTTQCTIYTRDAFITWAESLGLLQ